MAMAVFLKSSHLIFFPLLSFLPPPSLCSSKGILEEEEGWIT